MNDNLIYTIAVLQHNKNENKSPLEMYVPLVIDALNDFSSGEKIIAKEVKARIKKKHAFDLHIDVVKRILETLVNLKFIQRGKNACFTITPNLPKTEISALEIEESKRKVNFICDKLIETSSSLRMTNIDSREKAMTLLEKFVSSYAVETLAFFHDGNNLNSDIIKDDESLVVLYLIKKLSETNLSSLEYFIDVVEYCILQNILLHTTNLINPDSQNYKLKSFYLDTRFVLSLLDLDGEESKEYSNQIKMQITKNNGNLRIFEHTKNEIASVIDNAIKNFDNISYYNNSIINACRIAGKRKSDLHHILNNLNDILRANDISCDNIPRSEKEYIDKEGLRTALRVHISTYNTMALEHDVECVDAMSRLWSGKFYTKLEEVPCIFVTTNVPLSREGKKAYQKISNSTRISPVITTNSLGIYFWLNSPQSTELTKSELLAYANVLLKPSNKVWESVIKLANDLKSKSIINSEEYSYLISSSILEEEMLSKSISHEEFTEEEIQRLAKKIQNEKESLENENKSISTLLEQITKRTKNISHYFALISTVIIYGMLIFFWYLFSYLMDWSKLLSLIPSLFLVGLSLVITVVFKNNPNWEKNILKYVIIYPFMKKFFCEKVFQLKD